MHSINVSPNRFETTPYDFDASMKDYTTTYIGFFEAAEKVTE